MRCRLSLAVLLASALLHSGLGCDATPSLVIQSPAEGTPVTSFDFTVQIATARPAELVPGSLRATLNGVPLVLAGGPIDHSAVIHPGAPLADHNVLHVEVKGRNGVSVSIDRAFDYAPPKARVRRITDAADLIGGPLAHSRIGDWLIENSRARFVVQDVGQRDLYSIGQFGGNLIDAELVGRPNRDQFFEIQPSINIESVVNAQTVVVVNDGADGTPAILRTCGPDDTLDFINPSSVAADVGATFPPAADDVDRAVEACTEYVLEPLVTDLRLDTTLTNLDSVDRGFYVGDYVNGMGELEQWTNSGFGIGELPTATMGFMSFFGFAGGEGVDYSLVTRPWAGAPFAQSTFFTQTGVSFVLSHGSVPLVLFFGVPPSFVVPANGSKSYTRHVGVGPGSGGSATDLDLRLRGEPNGTIAGCVTAGDAPAPSVRVGVGPANPGGTAITSLVSAFVTDASGCYSGTLPTGSYGVIAGKEGHPFEGGGPRSPVKPITVSSGSHSTVDFALPDTGRVHVDVSDETGAPLPARVTIAGFDPSPEPTVLFSGGFGLPSVNTGLLNDVAADPAQHGIVRIDYAGADGVSEFALEPGSYQLIVSRGTEYSAVSMPITVAAGSTTTLAAQIAHVVETPGFVSSDYHVHAIASPDSRVSNVRRVRQFAGEGIDNVIMTDHESRTDLDPVIQSLGLVPFLAATVGEEITTFDYGHFNAYPLQQDHARVSQGAVDFGGAAPPGQDFVSFGNYNLSPAQIEAVAKGAFSTPDTVVQINHISSHFGPLKIDSSLVPPRSLLSASEKLALRLDPSIANHYHHFEALELWNGYTRSHQNEFLSGRIGIWFNHLNQGLPTTMIGDTDTHEYVNTGTAGARTWTPASPGTDAPAAMLESEIGQAIKAGRAVSGQGLYVQTRLLAADGSGNAADFTRSGGTTVASSNGNVDLEIRVQAPAWAEYDRIEVYANATPNVAGINGGVPVAFGPGTPAVSLDRGTGFDVDTVNVFPSVAGGVRQQTIKTVSFTGLTEDTWFVVVVRGRDGVSRPLWPVMPGSLSSGSNQTLAQLLDGNLGENGTLALGNTNALYADVDGTPGFQAPLAP